MNNHIGAFVFFARKSQPFNSTCYKKVVAEDGEEAVEVFNKANPDLVVLDVMMPKMDGYGVCYDCHGKIIYKGEWKSNFVHGKGIYIWEEGKRYEGEFLNGKKHGYGTFYLNNELVYEGTWKFDKPCIFDRSLDEIFKIKK